MAEAGRKLAEILAALSQETKAGVSTAFLDKKSFELIKAAGAEPAFLGYRPTGAKKSYPATLCVSLNDIVVHGVPSERVIEDGDLVKLDLGLKYKGFYVDAALTVGAGNLDDQKKKLIEVAERALELGISQASVGKALGDIGFVIKSFVEAQNFSIIEMLTGHGIGRQLHEEPNVDNFGWRGKGEKLKAGAVFTIEPMIAAAPPPAGGKIKQLRNDKFDGIFATANGALSAHFEHTVAVTENGPSILTRK